jgi:hypothetical protein
LDQILSIIFDLPLFLSVHPVPYETLWLSLQCSKNLISSSTYTTRTLGQTTAFCLN